MGQTGNEDYNRFRGGERYNSSAKGLFLVRVIPKGKILHPSSTSKKGEVGVWVTGKSNGLNSAVSVETIKEKGFVKIWTDRGPWNY